MWLHEIEISIDELGDLNVEDVLVSQENISCSSLSVVFHKESSKYEEHSLEWRVYSLFSAITNFYLKLDSINDAFGPTQVKEDKRTPLPQDFSQNQLMFFMQILPKLKLPVLKARILDVLWEMRFGDKPYRFAEEAIEHYLNLAESALQIESHDFYCVYYSQRASAIANKINYSKKDSVSQKIESFLGNKEIRASVFIGIAELLLKNHYIPSEKYLKLAEDIYSKSLSVKDYSTCENLCDLLILWYLRLKDTDREKQYRIEKANLQVTIGDEVAEQENFMVSVHYYKEAFDMYRKIGGFEATISELRKKIKEYQLKFPETMQAIETIIQIPNFAKQSLEVIQGKNKQDAILAFALSFWTPKKKSLRESVLNNPSVLLNLVNQEIVDEQGRTIAKANYSDSEETAEKNLQAQMHTFANIFHGFIAEMCIKPGLEILTFEHSVSEEDILFLVNNNPFIPYDRRLLYLKGLIAGFKYDFITSSHILIPQVENSLRLLLNNIGVITTTQDSNGIEEERDLGWLLENESLISILGENTVFDLSGLLISRFGFNLRNKLAHGLIKSDDFDSSPMVYFWCLILRICASPYFEMYEKGKQNDNHENQS